MANTAPALNTSTTASGGSAEIRSATQNPVPPSPGTILVGEAAQLSRLKNDMTRTLGSRLNKRQGLEREHYERFQRALCGVSTDADFNSGGAAWRGPWSDEIRAEVVAQINRLQHSTGFRHFKTVNIPFSAVTFESVFGSNVQSTQFTVPRRANPAAGEDRPSIASSRSAGEELRQVKDTFSKIERDITGLEERHATQCDQAQKRHDDLLKMLREQQNLIAEISKNFTQTSLV